MTLVEKRVPLAELLDLPEKKPALEYEDGAITQKVTPKARHVRLQMTFAARVDGFALPRHIAMAFPELRTTFAGRSYVPDVSVYRWERIPTRPDGTIADDLTTPPDIAVEIVSPGQSVNRLIRRCLWYVENGVQIALLIDPEDGSVMVFRPGAPPRPVRDDEPIELGDVLPEFRLTAGELFDALKLGSPGPARGAS